MRPEGRTLSSMLEAGEIDGFIGAARAARFRADMPNIGWLFPDPVAAAKDYYKRTGIFPIMHMVGVRRELAEQHPWLPGAVFKAFERVKDDRAGKTCRHVVDQGDAAVRRGAADGSARADGRGFLVVRRCANRKTLETFLRHHHAQGLSSRLVTVEEMFHPGHARDIQALGSSMAHTSHHERRRAEGNLPATDAAVRAKPATRLNSSSL